MNKAEQFEQLRGELLDALEADIATADEAGIPYVRWSEPTVAAAFESVENAKIHFEAIGRAFRFDATAAVVEVWRDQQTMIRHIPLAPESLRLMWKL